MFFPGSSYAYAPDPDFIKEIEVAAQKHEAELAKHPLPERESYKDRTARLAREYWKEHK